MTNIVNNYQNIMDRYNLMIRQSGLSEKKSEERDFSSLGLGQNFGDLLSTQVDKLNGQQLKADGLIQDFASGNIDDLHEVMIGVEEARLSMELAVQVRNKIVEAYKELNNMQL